MGHAESTSTAPPVRRPGRPRDSAADLAILEATVALAASVGLGSLSIEAVAARAGVAKTTVYRRWATKEALVLDAWRTLVEPLPVPDTGTLRGDLLALVGAIAAGLEQGRGVDVLPHLIAAARNDVALATELAEFLRTRRLPLAAVLERGRTRGELAPEADLVLARDVLLGPLVFRALVTDDPVDARAVEDLVELVVAGLSRGPDRAPTTARPGPRRDRRP